MAPSSRTILDSLGYGLFCLLVLDLCVNCAVPPRARILDWKNEMKPITLEDILSGSLSPRGFAGNWVLGSDNLIRTAKPPGVIVDYNVLNGHEEMVLNISDITTKLPQGSPMTNLIFSNDGKYILVEHGRSNLWRYSAVAKYNIYDVEKREMVGKLVPPGESKEQQTLQLVQWSPTGNGIAFIYKYNIYYRPDAASNTEVRQLTFDGSEEDAIYNGIADWVYEEEMLGGPTALWISKTGEYLAFVKFNDSQVMEFQWPIYGEPGSNETIYPVYRKIRYPKSGSPNPEAHVFVVSLTDANSVAEKMEYPQTDEKDLHLIGTATWASGNQLLVATLDRDQRTSQWHLCSVVPASCEKIYTYKLEHGWVDVNTPKVSADGEKFIFIRSQRQEEGDESYNHVVMFMKNMTSKVITKGRLSVGDILGWDEIKHRIYFSGSGSYFNRTHVVDPTEQHIYSISDNGEDPFPLCITCGLLNSAGNLCRENSAIFSANFSNFIHKCDGPDVPESTTRHTDDGTPVLYPGPTCFNNTALRETLKKKAVPITRDYEVKVGDNGRFVAKIRLYIPADFDETKKYPLLISVYAGPGSQNLRQAYEMKWETSLVSDKHIIFGQIDGRGTGRQSSEHLFEVHRKLGTAEVQDQITATKWLVENVPFIDAEKTSIWGWSYGGFTTIRVLETDEENVFKCGIAVAPVTNWKYYDTIYTERYMGLPNENAAYEYSDTTTKEAVKNLTKKQFMLIHGNADDNVHYQQSMILARALEQNDIFFHQLSYPDENHVIGGLGMRQHLYHSLQRFLFDECFSTSRHDPSPGSESLSVTASASQTSFKFAIQFALFLLIAMYVRLN